MSIFFNTILKNIFTLKFKFNFFPPAKCELLIYDSHSISSGFVNILFKKKKYVVLDNRYESINLYVLLLSILSFKFNDLKNTYKKKFISIVKPKIIYTAIDNNPSFFNLKNICPEPFYISDQNAIAKSNYETWPNQFSRSCKKINKESKNKLRADLLFVFNKNDANNMSKLIDGKINILGSTKCNNFFFNGKKNKKISKILFINSGLYKETIKKEILLFEYVKKFAQEKKLKLVMISKKDKSYKKIYKETFGTDFKWTYCARKKNPVSSYKNFSSDCIIIFSHSTLGLEALAMGYKCALFLYDLSKKNINWRDSNNGFFWSNKIDYQNISAAIERVIECSYSEWLKKTHKVISKYLVYDYKNLKKKKFINLHC